MIEIREVKKEDLDTLAQIYVAAYQDVNISENWTPEAAHKLLDYWLMTHPDLAYLAKYQDNITGGFFVGVKPWWDGNHLYDGEMFVDPLYQGNGIGTLLLKSVFEVAKTKYQVVAWDAATIRNSIHPLQWYKKLGFQELDELTLITCNVDQVLSQLNRAKK